MTDKVIDFPAKPSKPRAYTKKPFSTKQLCAHVQSALAKYRAQSDGVPPLTVKIICDGHTGELLSVEASGFDWEANGVHVVVAA